MQVYQCLKVFSSPPHPCIFQPCASADTNLRIKYAKMHKERKVIESIPEQVKFAFMIFQ